MGAGVLGPGRATGSRWEGSRHATIRRTNRRMPAPVPRSFEGTRTRGIQDTRKSRSSGRAGFDIVPDRPPGTRRSSAQCATGHSAGRAMPGSPGSEAGRRRTIGVVAALQPAFGTASGSGRVAIAQTALTAARRGWRRGTQSALATRPPATTPMVRTLGRWDALVVPAPEP